MNLSLKTVTILVALTAALSVALTRYYWPRPGTNTTTVEQHEVIKNQIITVTKEVIRPDGTKETETTTKDNSTTSKSSDATKLVMDRPSWLFSVGASKSALDRPELYQATVQKRVLGPLWVGATVSTERSVGVVLTLEY